MRVEEAKTAFGLHEGNCFGSPALLAARWAHEASTAGKGGEDDEERQEHQALLRFTNDGISVVASPPSCALARMPQRMFIAFLDANPGPWRE